jgi:serine protease AprX
MRVADLDGASAQLNRSKWQATVSVSVVDAEQNPVSDAAVSGAWSGGYTGTASCTTGEDGQCSLATGPVSTKQSSATFAVESITHATYDYQAADNTDPDGDSDGTTITVAKP